jgi:hypothetical protein
VGAVELKVASRWVKVRWIHEWMEMEDKRNRKPEKERDSP